MSERKEFTEPELIKYEKPLDEVTLRLPNYANNLQGGV